MKFKRALCLILAIFCLFGVCVPSDSSLGEYMSASAYTAQAELPAPTNVTASVTDNKAVITWDAVEGADGYRVYKYDRDKKKFVRLKTVAGTKCTVSDLERGKSYFIIAAVEKSDNKYLGGELTKKITVTVSSSESAKSDSTVSTSTSTSSNKATATSKTSGMTSVELAKAMGNGWNLGNTMESVATWLSSGSSATKYETAWGQPVTTKEMMTNLKAAGFDSVRIPVAWSNMMDSNYNISDNYFKHVDEIVGYVLDNDMYCIINIHWDGGWWDGFYSSDEDERNAAWEKYESMWTQIAKHYKNYSDKLIFESANEELGTSYDTVNEINQTFVDIVRSSGGNNKERFLLIAGYNTDIDKTCDSRFKMPEDTVSDKLLISVHYYTPSVFCIADKSDNSWGYQGSWGMDEDKEQMRENFEKMKKFTDAGYGVVIGEYGVTFCTDGNKQTLKDGTYDFFESVVELSEEYGYCAMLWDCNDWFKRIEGKFRDEELAEIYG